MVCWARAVQSCRQDFAGAMCGAECCRHSCSDGTGCHNLGYHLSHMPASSSQSSCSCKKHVLPSRQDRSGSIPARLPPDSAPLAMQQADSPVSIQLRAVLVAVFQKRMQRSAVPPPEASRPCWWGDHAMACNRARPAKLKCAQQAVGFTAALLNS